MTDIIIIGAGAAGLSAAKMLSEAGYSITICEARDRIGGKIHTINGDGFSFPVEGGAEFIHGKLPHTQTLLEEANVAYRAGAGQTWNMEKHQLTQGDLFDKEWNGFINKLNRQKNDITIDEFLKAHFSDPKYRSLVDGVKRFVQGYDAADISKASALALREEWNSEDIQGYRPVGGYSQLIEHLWSRAQVQGAELKLSSRVTRISWREHEVQVTTDKNEVMTAQNVLVTVPVSVLKCSVMQFDPPLREHEKAWQLLEVGSVIKFLFEFKHRIWETGDPPFNQMPGLNFLFSDAFVPTWWTQCPSSVPLLTGWLAGPDVQHIQQDDNALLSTGLSSLCYLFGCTTEQMEKVISAAKVINWHKDPYARGAYAYKTLKTSEAIKLLRTGVAGTIYFAGEALYDGAEMGTVEAALASGKETAMRMRVERVS